MSSSFIEMLLFPPSRVPGAVLAVLTVALMYVAIYLVFMVVPDEQIMGAVQRIFYFHVGSAFACYSAVGILLFASALYLHFKDSSWDCLARASSAVAFCFCTIVLITGMIWGHSAWNTWWRWEPRLVSSLMLWLLLFSHLSIEWFLPQHPRREAFSAVLGIACAIVVPIVVFSVKLLDFSEQLHPQVVANQGLKDARFGQAFAFASFALICFALWLTFLRARQLVLDQKMTIVGARRG